MPRDNPVTRDEVFKACYSLLRKGQNITGTGVREWVGDRGSNGTILKYIREWRESITEGRADSLPPALPSELLEPVQKFYDIVFEVARREFRDDRDRIEDELSSWKERASAAESKLADAEARTLDAEQRIAMLAEDKAGQADLLRQEREAHDVTRDSVRSLEHELDTERRLGEERRSAHQEQVATFEQRILDLHELHASQLKALQDQLETANARYESQNAYAMKEIEKARESERKAEKRHEVTQQKAEATIARQDETVTELRQQLRNAEKALRESDDKVRAVESRSQALADTNLDLEKRLAVAETRLATLQTPKTAESKSGQGRKTTGGKSKSAK